MECNEMRFSKVLYSFMRTIYRIKSATEKEISITIIFICKLYLTTWVFRERSKSEYELVSLLSS